jgi:hypothetical protein
MMKNKLLISTLLLSSGAWALSCIQPPQIVTTAIDEDLVEVKVFETPGICNEIQIANSECLQEPDVIDTLSHLRMMDELKTKYEASNFSGILKPTTTRNTDPQCEIEPCINGGEMEIDVDILSDFKNNLDESYIIAYSQGPWDYPSKERVLFFNDTLPQTIADFNIKKFLCNSDLDHLGEPGRFIIKNDTIYQQAQPGLSIPLASFLDEVGLEKTANAIESILQLKFDPQANYKVISIEGKILFSGIGQKAVEFLSRQVNANQFKLLQQ